MLSKVAESIYWLNRYMERAENYSRIIDANFQMSLDLNENYRQWEPLVYTTGDQILFKEKYKDFTRENVIQFVTYDLENPNSILSCIHKARENARVIRDLLSTELWEILNESYLELKNDKGGKQESHGIQDFYKKIRHICLLFYGCMDATVSHDTELWSFGMLGRFIERGDKTTRVLDMKYYVLLPSLNEIGSEMDLIQWVALLKSTSALGMFKMIYQKISSREISEFLILNKSFPRSILYCIKQIQKYVKRVSNSSLDEFANEAERKLGHFLSDLNYSSIETIFTYGLHEYLDTIQLRLNIIGEEIEKQYFQ